MKNARVATDNAGGQLSCGGHLADGRPREAIWSGWGGGLPELGRVGVQGVGSAPSQQSGFFEGAALSLSPGPRPSPHPGPAVDGSFQPLCHRLNEGGGRPLSRFVI